MTIPWPDSPGPDWQKNEGEQPEASKGKRVAVVLMNGEIGKPEGTPTAPPGWAADRARWSISRPRFPFDIAWYRIL